VPGGDATQAAAAYAAGPVSRLVAWGERQPLLGWWFYLGLGLATYAWGVGVEWAAGTRPLGSMDVDLAIAAPYGPFGLALWTLGLRIAKRALVVFWPATGWPESDRPAWNERMSFERRGPELLALALGALGGIAALLSTPAGVLGPESSRGVVYAAYLPVFVFGYATTTAGALTAVRWLRLTARIHREAMAVDVFDREPIYAFSRLTVMAGLGYSVAAYYSLTVNGAFQVGNAASALFIGGTMLFAVLVFTVPMWGIHERLNREKEALIRDVERRTNALVTELYARVDAGEFESTGVITSALSGTQALRERIDRLSTWPWPPQVLRGFVSALVLPLVIFILTRYLGDLL